MPTDKEMRRQYLRDNPEDELEKHLSGEGWDAIYNAWGYMYPPYGSEVVHHIWRGGTGMKTDLWSLLITVSPAAHNFVHTCPKHGVIACIYVKLLKDEFDEAEVFKDTGVHILGVISNWLDNAEIAHPWYIEMAEKIEDMSGLVPDHDQSPA